MDGAIRKMIGDYTREAGVRQLERLIGAICRKSIVKLTAGKWEYVIVTPRQVAMYLKKEIFESVLSETIEVPGISTGLAVTSVGGDILFIEATRMDGNGQLTVTGQLGDVMKESAKIAHSYVRSKAKYLEIEPAVFKDTDVHLHVPAEVRETLKFILVDHIDEAIEAGLRSVEDGFDPADPGIDLLLNQPGAELLAVTAA
jgi:ATP-dependent Lon protease